MRTKLTFTKENAEHLIYIYIYILSTHTTPQSYTPMSKDHKFIKINFF